MQLEFLKYLQEMSNPFLDTFFILITNLGSEVFFILAITYIYWCVDKNMGIRLFFIIMTSVYINNILKELFHIQRPIYAEGINAVYKKSAPGYSFPSGHSQTIATFWIYLMKKMKNKRLYIIGWSSVIFVAFSRLYLRVHWPLDVIAGIVIAGSIVIVLDYTIEKMVKYEITYSMNIIICAFISMILLLSNFNEIAVKILGLTTAALIGYFVENKYIHFQEKSSLKYQIVKCVSGVFIFIALQILMKKAFPSGIIANYMRYFIVGVWVTLIAPALFKKFIPSFKISTSHTLAE
ncbi:phosphatase PAP2 family protein [Lutibacter sp. B2]|nr:phosphatase PAP2 family protein [Lutibacter sp. B2]